MVEIIPGILEKDWNEIEKKLEIVKSFAKTVHVDIIDGKFASNTTFLDPQPFAKYSQNLFLELHMMVDNPIQYLRSFAKSGFKRFLGHVEKMPDQAEFVTKAKEFGEVGLAIDGPTDLSAIKVPYTGLDSIVIMTIKAGMSGQTFNPEYLKKVEMLKSSKRTFLIGGGAVQYDNGEKPIIEVDGGINDQAILLAIQAGANRFIANSFIFNAQDPHLQFNCLKTIAEK